MPVRRSHSFSFRASTSRPPPSPTRTTPFSDDFELHKPLPRDPNDRLPIESSNGSSAETAPENDLKAACKEKKKKKFTTKKNRRTRIIKDGQPELPKIALTKAPDFQLQDGSIARGEQTDSPTLSPKVAHVSPTVNAKFNSSNKYKSSDSESEKLPKKVVKRSSSYSKKLGLKINSGAKEKVAVPINSNKELTVQTDTSPKIQTVSSGSKVRSVSSKVQTVTSSTKVTYNKETTFTFRVNDEMEAKNGGDSLTVTTAPATRTPSFKRKKPENIEVKENSKENSKEKSNPKKDSTSEGGKKIVERKDSTHSLEGMLVTNVNLREFNVVLLGDMGVGKTALAVRFVTRRYIHEYDSKIERTYDKSVSIKGEEVFIRLWDTVAKSWDNFSDTADGFIIIYSITSQESYENSKNIIKSIRNSDLEQASTIPILMVGNKTEIEPGRKVAKENGDKFAHENGCIFKELSVACMHNLDGIIKGLIIKIQAHKRRLAGLGSDYSSSPTSPGAKQTSLSRKGSNAKHSAFKNYFSKKSHSKEKVV